MVFIKKMLLSTVLGLFFFLGVNNMEKFFDRMQNLIILTNFNDRCEFVLVNFKIIINNIYNSYLYFHFAAHQRHHLSFL